ncbi:MAG: hypothetical protein R3D98_17910 [Candidatus Krumholzibacteriia bacterium]
MLPATRWLLSAALVLATLGAVAAAKPDRLDSGDRSGLDTRQRTVAGDLCDTATSLARGGAVAIDLCQAWNDYDPGAHGCSPCALPGPDVVFLLDTQPGEDVRLTTSIDDGAPDVRLYLATDCSDPVGTCLAASGGNGAGLHHVISQGGLVYLFIDTTEECGEVSVTRQDVATTARTSWGALKAIYY